MTIGAERKDKSVWVDTKKKWEAQNFGVGGNELNREDKKGGMKRKDESQRALQRARRRASQRHVHLAQDDTDGIQARRSKISQRRARRRQIDGGSAHGAARGERFFPFPCSSALGSFGGLLVRVLKLTEDSLASRQLEWEVIGQFDSKKIDFWGLHNWVTACAALAEMVLKGPALC